MAIQQSSELRANPAVGVMRAICLKRALYECPRCNCVFNYAQHFTAHMVSHFKAEALRGCKRLPLGQPGDNNAKKRKEDANAEGDAMEDSVGPGATAQGGTSMNSLREVNLKKVVPRTISEK